MSDTALASPRGSNKYDRLLFLAKPNDNLPGSSDAFAACVLPEHIAVVAYNPQEATLSGLLDEAKHLLGDHKVRSIGLMCPTINQNEHKDGDALWICGKRDDRDLSIGGVLSVASLRGNNPEVQDWLKGISALCHSWGRIHILSPFLLPRGKELCQVLRDQSGLSIAAGPTFKNRFVLTAEDADDTVNCAGCYFSKAYLDRWVKNPEALPNRAAPASEKKAAALTSKFKEAASDDDNMARDSVMVAAFLSVFVQQKCPARPGAPVYIPLDHTCTFWENVNELTPYNELVLAINAVTCFVLLLGQYVYTKREWWMIEKLDADPREPYDALAVQSFQEEFPELYRDLRTINRRAFIVSAATLGFIILNFILSAVLVLRPFPTGYYDGPRTFTGLITNTLLVVIQIKNATAVCYSSWKNDMAISSKSFIPKSFNVVDKDMELLRVQAEAEADAAADAALVPVQQVTVVSK